MKYALISEEQIKQIEELLHVVRNSYAGESVLNIIQSLKPQEPVAWKDRTYGNLHHQNWSKNIPLFALEQL